MKTHVNNLLVSFILITFISLSCTNNKVNVGSTDTSSCRDAADSLALEITEPVIMGKEYDLIAYGGKGDEAIIQYVNLSRLS